MMKFRRFIAWSLLWGILLAWLPVEVHADSNDRRSALINLGGGQTLSSINASSNIDEASLQVLSLYLSNYYVPFTTILDGDYTYEEADKTKNEKTVNQMKKALADNCGMTKQAADFLTNYLLSQSLNTCTNLYVKVDALDRYFSHWGGEDDYSAFFPFATPYNLRIDTVNRTMNYGTVGKDSDQTNIFYKYNRKGKTAKERLAGYLKYFGAVYDNNNKGIMYTKVSYPVLLGIMQYSMDTSINSDKFSTTKGRQSSSEPLFGNEEARRTNFYFRDSTGVFRVCFSNSLACQESFALALNMIDTTDGYGTAFSSLDTEVDSDAKSVQDLNGRTLAKAMAMLNMVYVNWEGSLVLDNGVYRTPILPGCSNPHMITKIDDPDAYSVPLQNLVAIDSFAKGMSKKDSLGFSKETSFVNTSVTRQSGSSVLKNLTPDGTKASDTFNGGAIKVQKKTGSLGLPEMPRPAAAPPKARKHKKRNNAINGHRGKKNKSTNDTSSSSSSSTGLIVSSLDNSVEADILDVSSTDTEFLTKQYLWTIKRDTSKTDFDLSKNILKTSWGKNEYIYSSLKLVDYLVYVGYGRDGADTFTFPSFNMSNIASVDSDAIRTVNKLKLWGMPSLCNELVFYDGEFSGINSQTKMSDVFKPLDIRDSDALSKLNANLTVYASFNNLKVGGVADFTSVTKQLARPLFWTYCFAKFNENKNTFDADTCIVNVKLNTQNFPTFNSNIDWSTLYADSLSDQVLSFVYYLLHPTEGIAYVATLIKNKLGGFLIKWHEDIVGSTDSNASLGMTKYLGTSSYTSTSSLGDIPWIANLLAKYNSLIVYFIIAMCLILLCYILVGSLSIQRAVIGIIMFSFLAFTPPLAINATTGIINTISDKTFSAKFDYWGITQLENYLITHDNAKGAKDKGDYSSYQAFVISQYSQDSQGVADSAPTSYGGTKLKWMSPKKYSSMAMLSEAMSSVTNNTSAKYLTNLMFGSIAKATSGETYLDSDNALYLYRDYTDIYRSSAYSYNIENVFNYSGGLIDASNRSKGITIYKPIQMAVGWVDGTFINNYQHAWRDIPNVNQNLRNLVLLDSQWEDTATAPSNKGAIYDISSGRATKYGFLIDTSVTQGNTKYYLHTNFEPFTNKGLPRSLAVSYLMNYNNMYRYTTQALDKFNKIADKSEKMKLGSIPSEEALKKGDNGFNFGSYYGSKNSNHYIYGTSQILGLRDENLDSFGATNAFDQLSSYFYGLHSESPYYFFNHNIRDQITKLKLGEYQFNPDKLSNARTDGATNPFSQMLLDNNQGYFYNFNENAGNGYGEMRDFMNLHDLFYYIIPSLRSGTELARAYDKVFGLYTNDDTSLRFNTTGKFTYNNIEYDSLSKFSPVYEKLDDEHKYKFWHSYNTFTILQNYTAWLDTMMDCDYAKSETIRVMDDKFVVTDPLNPFSYFRVDDKGSIVEGRPMVFSRSEMGYYGLTDADLTVVERKLIKLQDTVYKKAIDLMNYYTLSDETLITSFALIQLFEFNSTFSQSSYIGKSYTLYPQGYELKAFSYDAYLRMILSEASGEPLMTGKSKSVENPEEAGAVTTTETTANTSIYRRILENTSLFFAVFLLFNDILAVYLIPGLKLFFIVAIFIVSVLMILASVLKLEMNLLKVIWKSLIQPLIKFSAVAIGMSIAVSMFMGSGADGVYSSSAVIQLGDPTTALILMIILNTGAVILYFKICKSCFKDLVAYGKAVFTNMGGAIVGGLGALASGRAFKGSRAKSTDDITGGRSAKDRGKANSDSITSGVGNSIGTGLSAHHTNADGTASEQDRERERIRAGMNKYDQKAYDKWSDKSRASLAKSEALDARLKGTEEAYGKGSSQYKRLSKARDRMETKYLKQDQKAQDIQKLGRFGAFKKDMQNNIGKAKDIASKAKAGGGRLKSGVMLKAGTVKATVTNLDTYRRIGNKAGSIANIPSKAKKGITSAGSSLGSAIKSGVSAAGNAPSNIKRGIQRTPAKFNNAVNTASNTIKRNARAGYSMAMYKGKNAISSARGAVSKVRDVASDVSLAAGVGYLETRQK